MRRMLMVLVAAFGLTLVVPQSAAQAQEAPSGISLSVPVRLQQCQAWCWAAALQMVAEYYGTYGGRVDQCTLASIRDRLIGPNGELLCCVYGCGFARCDRTIGEVEFGRMIGISVNLRHEFRFAPLAEYELQAELLAGRPVIIGLRGYAAGHVNVIRGFYYAGGMAFYEYVDPLYGTGATTYYQLLNGYLNGSAVWISTWYGIMP